MYHSLYHTCNTFLLVHFQKNLRFLLTHSWRKNILNVAMTEGGFFLRNLQVRDLMKNRYSVVYQ